MEGILVGLRVHSNGLDTELVACPDNSQGNFTAIRD
jgi:hypothetical protein